MPVCVSTRGVAACAVGHHELAVQRRRTHGGRAGSADAAVLASGPPPRHAATWSERLVRCAEGMRIALGGGVDRGTAEAAMTAATADGSPAVSRDPQRRGAG